jgi:hypothetical protein
MGFTGIVLYIVPHGRIARWMDWHLFGLDKTQYQALHTTSMILFLAFGILHIYYNWKPIVNYMKNSTQKISFTKKEFLIALFLNLFFVVGTLFQIQPFKGFLDLGESIKSSWAEKINDNEVKIMPPPERLNRRTLRELSDMGNIDLNKAVKILEARGLDNIDPETRIKEISEQLNMDKTEVYKLLTR